MGIGTRSASEKQVAKVAGNLVMAWDSGDRSRLEAAVRQATLELSQTSQGSAMTGELRDLVLGVVEGLDSLLRASQTASPQQGGQWDVCYDLLRHVRGAAEPEAFFGAQG